MFDLEKNLIHTREKFNHRLEQKREVVLRMLYWESLRSYAMAINLGQEVNNAVLPCLDIDPNKLTDQERYKLERPEGWLGRSRDNNPVFFEDYLGMSFAFRNLLLGDPDSKAELLVQADHNERALDFYYATLTREDPRVCGDDKVFEIGKFVKIWCWDRKSFSEGQIASQFGSQGGIMYFDMIYTANDKPRNMTCKVEDLLIIDPKKPAKINQRVEEIARGLIQKYHNIPKAVERISRKLKQIRDYNPKIPSSNQ